MKFIRWMTSYHMDGNGKCDNDYDEKNHMYDLTIWIKIPNLIKLISLKMTRSNEIAHMIDIKVTQMKFMFQIN
jgi:hypothetical protein